MAITPHTFKDTSMTGSPTSYTISYTLPTASPGIIVFIEPEGLAAPSSVTWNAVAMTLTDSSVAHNHVFAYTLANPASGTHNVVANFGASSPFGHITIISFNGVDQANPVNAHANNNTIATSISTSLTTTFASAMLVDMITDGTANPVVNQGQIRTTNLLEDFIGVGVSYKPLGSPGVGLMGWTDASSGTFDHVVVALQPARPSFLSNNLRPHAFSPGLAR